MSDRTFIAPTKRKRMSRPRRVSIFLAANGICHLCGTQIRDEPWEVSHPDPLALGGSDNDADLRPAHKRCHAVQTKTDKTAIAKRNRDIDKNYGGPEAKARQGFRGWRNFRGEAVWRRT